MHICCSYIDFFGDINIGYSYTVNAKVYINTPQVMGEEGLGGIQPYENFEI